MSTEEPRRRLVITEEDLAGVQPPAAASPAQAVPASAAPAPAPSLPPVQSAPTQQLNLSPVGTVTVSAPMSSAQPSPGLAFVRSVQGRNITAAACGVVLGWAICEITHFGLWTATSSLGADMTTGAFTAMVGLCFAFVYTGWEQILARNWAGALDALKRTAPVAIACAFATGFIADALYIHFVEQILKGLTLNGLLHIKTNAKIYLVRGLAWGLFGAGMGVAAGRGQAREKMVNGVIGGAIGGTIGGLVFNWAAFHISTASMSLLVGLLVIGICIGLAVGIVETLRREAWLHISGGPMAGKEFIVYGQRFSIGASPKCDMTLIKDPSIQPEHAAVDTASENGRQVRYLTLAEGAHALINGCASARQQRLRSGDVITLGASTVTFSERATAA
jgi:hypothetical protein